MSLQSMRNIDIGQIAATVMIGNEHADVGMYGKTIVIGNKTMEQRDQKVENLQKQVQVLESELADLQHQFELLKSLLISKCAL